MCIPVVLKSVHITLPCCMIFPSETCNAIVGSSSQLRLIVLHTCDPDARHPRLVECAQCAVGGVGAIGVLGLCAVGGFGFGDVSASLNNSVVGDAMTGMSDAFSGLDLSLPDFGGFGDALGTAGEAIGGVAVGAGEMVGGAAVEAGDAVAGAASGLGDVAEGCCECDSGICTCLCDILERI